MSVDAKILVVAPDEGFRRSLAFVLEAEGCLVDAVAQLPNLDGLPLYDCLVIERGSIPVRTNGAMVLSGLTIPAIVLSSHAEDLATPSFARVVVKPLLGHQFIEAVREALGQGFK